MRFPIEQLIVQKKAHKKLHTPDARALIIHAISLDLEYWMIQILYFSINEIRYVMAKHKYDGATKYSIT